MVFGQKLFCQCIQVFSGISGKVTAVPGTQIESSSTQFKCGLDWHVLTSYQEGLLHGFGGNLKVHPFNIVPGLRGRGFSVLIRCGNENLPPG